MFERLGLLQHLLVAVLVSVPVPLSAAPQDYQGKIIGSIRFQPAEQPLTATELAEFAQPVNVGRPYRAADIRAAIARLYSTGRYEDIAVDAALNGTGEVVVTFVTDIERFVRDVRVQGVPEPPNQGQLINATKLELGERYTPGELKQALEFVLGSLRLNGLYQAKVDASTYRIPAAQQIDIRIDVTAGSRARYDRPAITGTFSTPMGKLIDTTHWRRFMGFGGWRAVTGTRTHQGVDRIRRMLQKRDFLMATVTLEQMEYHPDQNRLTPHVTIEEGPRIHVVTEGASISNGRLRELLPVYQEQAVDRDLLAEGQRNLRQYLESQGYFEAKINFSVDDREPGQQTIVYTVIRGERHKFVHLGVDGNRYFSDETLRERMYLRPASLTRFRHGRYSGDYLRRDVNAIKQLYQANGFRDVAVDSQVIDDWKGQANDIAVLIKVDEGPQWFVNQLNIRGPSPLNLASIESMLQSSAGQPFSDYNLATDQDNILNYYYNNGYPEAAFDVTVSPAERPHYMNVRYTIREGERLYVREVLTSGFKATDPELVRSCIRNLNPGDPLSQSAITENQRRLYDLGIFARVDTAVQNLDGATDQKYVLYRFEEASRYSLNVGIGAEIARIGNGADPNLTTNPGGTAGFSPRISFGISRLNFMGQGHTVSLQTRISNIDRRALITYLAPQFKGNEDLSVTFTGLYDDARDINTFNAKRQEAAVQLSQRLSRADSMQYRIAFRRVTVDPNSIKIQPQLIDLYSQPVKLGIVSHTFIQDRRDDPIDPHRGMYNTLDNGLSSNLFGSKTTFTRSLLRNATYYRIGRDLVFARSTSFGAIAKISRAEIPLPERFYAGGASSLRAFGENQAGPRDIYTGFVIGGRALFTNIFELRFPFIGDNIGAVLFHDAGNVYSSVKNISFRFHQDTTRVNDPSGFEYIKDFDYMVHAVGFGIRYRTPVGPIRFDLAYALNPPEFIGFKGTREQLLLGQGTRTLQQLSHFQFHFSLGQVF